MANDEDNGLRHALQAAEERLRAKQQALADSLHAMNEAQRELKEARDEVHSLREALARWLQSRAEVGRTVRSGD
jgi:predicted  nucleic acid-binding Zn-ribbon protein